jgi:hypothetical protein
MCLHKVWMLLLLIASPAAALTLVDAGQSKYVIVLSANAISAEQFAAEELAAHVQRASGVKLPIITDAEALPARAILLGRTRFLKELGVAVDWKALGKEGYLLRVVGDRLVIAGGQPRGTLYGVYALLEDHLGCRWFAPDTSVIPTSKTIELPRLDVIGRPGFEYREPWMYASLICSEWWKDHYDPDYVARTRNSGRFVNEAIQPIDERHGGHFKIPYFGHNLSVLVPAAAYAKEHPEYFGLQPDGTRTTAGDLELCMTHPEVVRIAAASLRQWMRADPDADMFFFGQSDTRNICQCDRCLAAYRKYNLEPGTPANWSWGGIAGRNLEFLNQVAVLLEDEFPDKRIGTFAYLISRNPPQNIKAHRNVVIWYCPIERCTCHPVDSGPMNDFYDYTGEIKQWRQIAREIYVFDYKRADPGLLHIAPHVRAWHRLGVRGVLVDSIMDIQVGFGFLRYWLWMQSLNNPQWDAEVGLHEFLNAYYGAAAVYIDRYIRLVADPHSFEPLSAAKAGMWNATLLPPSSTEHRLSLWRHSDSPMRKEMMQYCYVGDRPLTDEAINRGHALFEQALEATADDPKARRHVEAARISLQYLMFKILPGDDPRLKDEAIKFLRVARQLELDVVARKPIAEFRDKLSKKLGVKLAE